MMSQLPLSSAFMYIHKIISHFTEKQTQQKQTRLHKDKQAEEIETN